MPNITPIDLQQPGAAAEIIATVKARTGGVPNIFATMAQSPAALEAYLAFNGALSGGNLSPTLREQIALTVAGENACDYCASAHTFVAKSVGVDASEAAHAASNPRTKVLRNVHPIEFPQ
jgi:AhpD family alkylhydroperoxidase